MKLTDALRCDCGYLFGEDPGAQTPTPKSDDEQASAPSDLNREAESTFHVQERQLVGAKEWTVVLCEDEVVFSGPEGRTARIERGDARRKLWIDTSVLGKIRSVNLIVPADGGALRLSASAADLQRLKEWVVPESKKAVESEIQGGFYGRGLALSLLGIAHFVVPKYLAGGWGVPLVILAALNILVRRRFVFLINGLALIVAGIWNLGLPVKMIGAMQIIWGLEEGWQFFAVAKRRKAAR